MKDILSPDKIYVQEYTNAGLFPAVGNINIIYIDKTTSTIYRWDGSVYRNLGGVWGTITGTIANQTDLANYINATTQTKYIDKDFTGAVSNTITILKSELNLSGKNSIEVFNPTNLSILVLPDFRIDGTNPNINPDMIDTDIMVVNNNNVSMTVRIGSDNVALSANTYITFAYNNKNINLK